MEELPLEVISAIKDMKKEKRDLFLYTYESRKKSTSTATILTLIGCIGLAGLQRFYLGQTGIGLLYILTGGLIGLGTIYDLIKIKDLVNEANKKIAFSVLKEIDILSFDGEKGGK
jgi:TM2 domain-containing membrane protein YozV